jgi:hypothetical protein
MNNQITTASEVALKFKRKPLRGCEKASNIDRWMRQKDVGARKHLENWDHE